MPDIQPKARRVRFEIARDGDTRTLTHVVATFIQRADHLRRQHHGGDIDQAIVAHMVGIAALDHQVRLPGFRGAHGDLRSIVGVEGQRGVNALSIAAATGIPRETVRRKLKELVALGAVMEKERGRYVMTPGFVQRPDNLAMIEQILRQFVQAMNDCVSLGVVRTVATED